MDFFLNWHRLILSPEMCLQWFLIEANKNKYALPCLAALSKNHLKWLLNIHRQNWWKFIRNSVWSFVFSALLVTQWIWLKRCTQRKLSYRRGWFLKFDFRVKKLTISLSSLTEDMIKCAKRKTKYSVVIITIRTS